ncbi:MAG: hypothetical protein WCY71_09395 [Halothiobacillaceae bacterium]
MAISLIGKVVTIWAAILVLAVANGVFREAVLTPKLGTTAGLVLSGMFLSSLILAMAYISLPWLAVREIPTLVLIGLGWLTLTVFFEFSFGLAQGKSLAMLFAAYTFKGGNIWPAVLLVTAVAPLAAAKLRGCL